MKDFILLLSIPFLHYNDIVKELISASRCNIWGSGGDTKFSLFLEIGSVWMLGVPLALLGALVWKLPVYWVYGFISLEELVKAFIGIPRVISKRWVRNVVENM